MRISNTEEESTSISLQSTIKYLLAKNKSASLYEKFTQEYNKFGINNFKLLYDREIFSDKDQAYDYLISKQNKLESSGSLLNDFVLSNEKVTCVCGFKVRKLFLEQHKEKYCRNKKKEPEFLEI